MSQYINEEPSLEIDEHDLCLLCKNCHGWWSEYFWSKEENPLDEKTIKYLKNHLFSKDPIVTYGDHGNKDINGFVINDTKKTDPKEYVANILENIAKSIRNQPFRNRAEWNKGKASFKCPECGKQVSLISRWDW